MQGLIIKDLLSLKNHWKQTLILFIGCLLICIALGNYLLCVLFVPIIISSSGITTFSTDEFFNTESYTLSLPLSRKQIVLAKYLFTFITILISLFLGALIYSLIDILISPGYNGLNAYMLFQLVLFECASVIVDFIFYPVIYKYGCEKSRLVLMAIVMVVLGIMAILSVTFNYYKVSFIDFNKILDGLETYGTYLLFIATIVVTIISYILSNLFFRHKDY